jgi:hypothetical protein
VGGSQYGLQSVRRASVVPPQRELHPLAGHQGPSWLFQRHNRADSDTDFFCTVQLELAAAYLGCCISIASMTSECLWETSGPACPWHQQHVTRGQNMCLLQINSPHLESKCFHTEPTWIIPTASDHFATIMLLFVLLHAILDYLVSWLHPVQKAPTDMWTSQATNRR